MSSARDSGGDAPDSGPSGGTQTLEREPQSRFPLQKVLIGAAIVVVVIGVVVLGVYEIRQGAPETTPALGPQTTSQAVYDGVPVTIKESGNLKKYRRTMRIVSAKADLTGKHELAWPADKGTVVGDAICTQNFQFSATAKAGTRPTLLVCWRTTPAKTVYTVAVDLGGKPSMQDSVTTLNKEWDAMG